MKNFLLNIFILAVSLTVVIYLYQTYKADMYRYFLGEEKLGIFVRDVPVTVSVADTEEKRAKGLSGVEKMPDREGKLFVFEKAGRYGFWMKDMFFSLDILWINDNGYITHIEKNVKPDSYPTVYSSPDEAKYVLELNAFFTDTFSIAVGDKVTLPPSVTGQSLQ